MDLEPQPPARINYLYFGVLCALLLFTTTCSILLKENLAGSRMFFWFYALGQIAMETSLFIYFGWLVRRFLGRIGFALFIGFTFVCFLLHLLDFVLDRILDLSVWDALKAFVIEEKLDNFLLLLDASGISLSVWISIFSLLIAVPIFGLLFYKGTNWLADKRPLPLKQEMFLQLFLCIPFALLFWDYSASAVIHPDAYTEFTKSLPWRRTFLMPETAQLSLPGPLQRPAAEKEVVKEIESAQLKAKKLPNIYLFVVESLRADFITPETAPHLFAFGEQNISAESSLSNGNWTSMGWFSIFHSQFSLFWTHLQDLQWKSGSPALQLFKKLGYQIRVYSSAQLGFYGMEELIFGENRSLIDSYQTFHHEPPEEACHSDAKAIAKLQADLADPELKQGQLCVIFWDATHFDYSWPKEKGARFKPVASEIAFFRTYPSAANIEKIKNRYQNSIYYMDQLFGSFLKTADSNDLIAFTGDHGEEFFDHGHLFHGSHLTTEQTSVPIFFRLGAKKQKLPLLSQMDIMPTLLDAVANQTFSFLKGESALRERIWPYVAIARFNAWRCPYEFCLHNGKNKLIAQFDQKKDIFSSTKLNILSLRKNSDQTCFECQGATQRWIHNQFGAALEYLFPAADN